jgi:hypothetical protein
MKQKRLTLIEYSLFIIPIVVLSFMFLPRINPKASADISQFVWNVTHLREAREKARRAPTCSKLKQIGIKQPVNPSPCCQ